MQKHNVSFQQAPTKSGFWNMAPTASMLLVVAVLCLPHASAGGWVLVFRQTLPFKYAKESDGGIWSQAKSFNAHNNSAPNFSILDQLEGCR